MIKEIVLTKKEKEFIKPHVEAQDTAFEAFRHASYLLKVTKHKIRDELENMFPEINDFNASFNREEYIIRYREEGVKENKK